MLFITAFSCTFATEDFDPYTEEEFHMTEDLVEAIDNSVQLSVNKAVAWLFSHSPGNCKDMRDSRPHLNHWFPPALTVQFSQAVARP